MVDTRPPASAQEIIENKMDYLAEMIGNVHELVEQRSPNDQALRAAVRDGIVAAASDPDVWAVAINTLRSQMHHEAGSWLFGGVRAFFSRLMWVCLIGLGIYMLGGWSALVAFVKTGAPHP